MLDPLLEKKLDAIVTQLEHIADALKELKPKDLAYYNNPNRR